MNIKVQGGVIGSTGPLGLCGSCKNAHVRETANDLLVLCESVEHERYARVTQPVLRCRSYKDQNHPSKYDFEAIAWVLNTDAKTKKVGFAPPKRRNE